MSQRSYQLTDKAHAALDDATPQTPTRADLPGHRPQDALSASRADGSAPGLATTGAHDAARCSVMQVADRDWWCVTHGRDADVCERETGQSDDTDPALPPFEPGGVA